MSAEIGRDTKKPGVYHRQACDIEREYVMQ